jgi:hypothetical protein
MKWVKNFITYLFMMAYTTFTFFLFVVMLMLLYGLLVEVFKYMKSFL